MIGTEIGFLENNENFTKGIDLEKVLQFRGTLNLNVIPLALPLLFHTERSISQTTCELKEVRFLIDEYTFLWKSVNLEQKSLSLQRRLNSEVASVDASLRIFSFDFVAYICKRIARFILLTTYIYSQRYTILTLKFLPRLKSWVSFEVN
ncbi:hypothetical protein M1590_04510 [Candidatus Marsarchaeota archaeon]|nr:hypothetical protein [Candidatus Marsarchaeota archaeon]